jgi:hypothetical protein
LLKPELDWNQIASFLVTRLQYSTKKVEHMRNIALAVAAAAVCTSAPLFIGSVPAKAESLKMAQLDVQVGRDRDDHAIRERSERRERRDRDVTVGFGPGGLTVGPRQRCRMVTTTIERDDGRRVTRRERQCD